MVVVFIYLFSCIFLYFLLFFSDHSLILAMSPFCSFFCLFSCSSFFFVLFFFVFFFLFMFLVFFLALFSYFPSLFLLFFIFLSFLSFLIFLFYLFISCLFLPSCFISSFSSSLPSSTFSSSLKTLKNIPIIHLIHLLIHQPQTPTHLEDITEIIRKDTEKERSKFETPSSGGTNLRNQVGDSGGCDRGEWLAVEVVGVRNG